MKTKTLKRSVCVLLAALMIFGLLAPSALGNQRHPFTDVSPQDDAAVQFLWERGIMVGTSGTQFSPSATLTRSMLATIIYRVAGEPQTTFRTVFNDVPSGRWYSVPVTWANDAGIVQGVGGGRFAPNDRLTREQLSAMMHRYAVSRGYNVSVPANVTAPAGTSGWATDYVRWAVYNGLISTNTPNAHASRAETANFVYRFMNLGTPPTGQTLEQEVRAGAPYGQLRNDFTSNEIRAAFEQELFRLINIERVAHGVNPLQWSPALAAASREHSIDMITNNFLGHGGSDGRGIIWRAMDAGWDGRVSENVGGGHSPSLHLDAIMNSPGHRANLLNPQWTHLGVGFAADANNMFADPRWTQKFGAPW